MTDHSTVRAFVVDDSVKTRRSKMMPGISSHVVHLNGRCVMGQQILTLGQTTEKQFIPLDSELYISRVKAKPLKEPDHWIKVKLLFVRGVIEEKQRAGKHDCALFFSTDSYLSDERILEIYALRWGIEVYFKEAKQKLGFL